MCDYQQRFSFLFKSFENLYQFPPAFRVKVGSRFIHGKYLRFHRKYCGKCSPPLLTSAEMVRDPVLITGKSDHFKSIRYPSLHLLLIQTEIDGAKSHIITKQWHKEHVIRVLKDDSDLFRHLVHFFWIDRFAKYLDGSK